MQMSSWTNEKIDAHKAMFDFEEQPASGLGYSSRDPYGLLMHKYDPDWRAPLKTVPILISAG